MKRTFILSRPAFRMVLALCSGLVGILSAEITVATPAISVSLRGVGESTIEVGEPLRVAVSVAAVGQDFATVTLAPTQGSWMDATVVEILSADGARVVGTAQPAARSTESTVLLDQENVAIGVWWFRASELSAVQAGDYLVRARLVIGGGSGWKEACVSPTVRLCMVPASDDPERVTQRVLSHAHAAVLERHPEKAAGVLDAVLAVDPDNVAVLKLRAAICFIGGDTASAHACITRAGELSARFGGEPSAELHELANRVAAAADTTPLLEVKKWASPPRGVFYPVRTDTSERTPAVGDTSTISAASPQAVKIASPSQPDGAAKGVTSLRALAPGVVIAAAELRGDKITPANSQWAVSAVAGSQYGKTQYSAAKATGAPNVMVAGNSPEAWCPANKSNGTDWLEVTFAKPVHASEVRVRQNDTVGAITKIEAIESDGTSHVWWEGVDPYPATAVREIVWFGVRVPKTDYLVAKVKITLNLAAMPGWKQIDAVQLIEAR